MKNIVLCHALLIAILPFSLQAMLFESPEKLHATLASAPLSETERQLVVREIETNGVKPILDKINDPNAQKSLVVLTLKGKFDRNSNDPLAKNIFSKIDSIESTPRSDFAIHRNYLGLQTRYYLKKQNNDNTEVTAKLSNIEEIRQICASFDQ
jgi:hypothetical protein